MPILHTLYKLNLSINCNRYKFYRMPPKVAKKSISTLPDS